jgi:hypothetical protein
MTDDRNRQRSAGHHAEYAASQGGDAFGVQVHSEQGVKVFLNEFKPLRNRSHHPRRFESLG